MKYLLDTSICVFFLRGKLDLNEVMQEKGRKNCLISEMTVFELRFGAESSENPEKSHLAVTDFINGLTIIPLYGIVYAYSKEKVRLRRIGKPMHDEFDLLIGVTALHNKLILATDNVKDFRHIDDLIVENWFIR